jgi:Uma2 family endonuclease
MSLPAKKYEYYTFNDTLDWEGRWELIDGIPYDMSPAPRTDHQRIAGGLYWQLRNFLNGRTCEPFIAPFDVHLNYDEGDDTVVQPDVIVVCDKSKLRDGDCKGAPDFVAEVLSPSTAMRDRTKKFQLYLRAGVKEYWIVDPAAQAVDVHILENGKYVTTTYDKTQTAPVSVLPGCVIVLSDVFPAEENEQS